MDFLNELFPIILYFLGAVLLVVIIMLVIKLLSTVDKINILLDDVEEKSQSLNGLFDALESVGNTISKANSGIAGFITNMTKKVYKMRKKMKRKKQEEEMDEDE